MKRRMFLKQRRKHKTALIGMQPCCIWCGKHLTYNTATIEHVLPLRWGGSNKRDNLALACEECNFSRGAPKVKYDEAQQIRATWLARSLIGETLKIPATYANGA